MKSGCYLNCEASLCRSPIRKNRSYFIWGWPLVLPLSRYLTISGHLLWASVSSSIKCRQWINLTGLLWRIHWSNKCWMSASAKLHALQLDYKDQWPASYQSLLQKKLNKIQGNSWQLFIWPFHITVSFLSISFNKPNFSTNIYVISIVSPPISQLVFPIQLVTSSLYWIVFPYDYQISQCS